MADRLLYFVFLARLATNENMTTQYVPFGQHRKHWPMHSRYQHTQLLYFAFLARLANAAAGLRESTEPILRCGALAFVFALFVSSFRRGLYWNGEIAG